MYITVFAIGETFPLMKAIPKGEGTALNYEAEGSLFVTINWANISSMEKREIKNGVIQFRYFKEGEYILPLMKLGSLPPMELPFDPTIYKKKGHNFKLQSNILSIYAIENSNNQIVTMRNIGLNQDFVNCWKNIWDANILSKDFSYGQWLNNFVYRFTINDLWNKATKIDWR